MAVWAHGSGAKKGSDRPGPALAFVKGVHAGEVGHSSLFHLLPVAAPFSPQQGEVGLVDRRPQPGTVWNRLTPQEEEAILREALRQPELS
jgi:hypothetical protein